MAFVVTDACVKDFLCVDECPLDGIAPKKNDPKAESVSQVYINPEVCVECGACMSVCQNNAISSPDQLTTVQAHFVQKNAAFFQ